MLTAVATPKDLTASQASALQRAAQCARIAEDNKGRDVVVLDMRGVTPLYDYLVLATGNSRRQLHNISEEIDAHMNALGEDRHGLEGYEASKWIIQDYGDVVVHLFDAMTRSYYDLEQLWADAHRVDWQRYE